MWLDTGNRYSQSGGCLPGSALWGIYRMESKHNGIITTHNYNIMFVSDRFLYSCYLALWPSLDVVARKWMSFGLGN